MGQIAVGPDSAGAEPGPAGYGRGGTQPTITDADIVLGRIDPTRFAGGKVALHPERASDAVGAQIGEPLKLEPTLAAYGIAEMVDETMANAARVHAVEQGADASEHTLIAFGGAAPLHVGRLAQKLGVERIIVPTAAGVGSAIGFLRAPVAYEVVRSRNMRLATFDATLANELMAEMRDEAHAVVHAGAPGAELTESRGAYMRYVGQGHEIFVQVPVRALSEADHATLRAAYDREYEALYSRVIPDAEVEVLTWALTVSTPIGESADAAPLDDDKADAEGVADPEPTGVRALFDPASETWLDVPLFWRDDLERGASVDGPALIAENETSTYVTAGFRARIAKNAHIVAERVAGESP